jgi:hypothetical protein
MHPTPNAATWPPCRGPPPPTIARAPLLSCHCLASRASGRPHVLGVLWRGPRPLLSSRPPGTRLLHPDARPRAALSLRAGAAPSLGALPPKACLPAAPSSPTPSRRSIDSWGRRVRAPPPGPAGCGPSCRCVQIRPEDTPGQTYPFDAAPCPRALAPAARAHPSPFNLSHPSRRLPSPQRRSILCGGPTLPSCLTRERPAGRAALQRWRSRRAPRSAAPRGPALRPAPRAAAARCRGPLLRPLAESSAPPACTALINGQP